MPVDPTPGRPIGQQPGAWPTKNQPKTNRKNAHFDKTNWHIFKSITNHNHANMTIQCNQMHININIAFRINNTTSILMAWQNHAILIVLYISKYASLWTVICIGRSKTKYTKLAKTSSYFLTCPTVQQQNQTNVLLLSIAPAFGM